MKLSRKDGGRWPLNAAALLADVALELCWRRKGTTERYANAAESGLFETLQIIDESLTSQLERALSWQCIVLALMLGVLYKWT
jgi:hypothetical protein